MLDIYCYLLVNFVNCNSLNFYKLNLNLMKFTPVVVNFFIYLFFVFLNFFFFVLPMTESSCRI